MSGFSVKPGRGPSAAGAVGAAGVAVFGVLWTNFALWLTSEGAFPWPVRVIFPLFGVVFVVSAIAGAVYHAYNATASNRFSTFDVTPTAEEPDPHGRPRATSGAGHAFCRRCGAGVRAGDNFCGMCGPPADRA